MSFCFRVDNKESLYTGFCPESESNIEVTELPTYCYCREDMPQSCEKGNYLTPCPSDVTGKSQAYQSLKYFISLGQKFQLSVYPLTFEV